MDCTIQRLVIVAAVLMLASLAFAADVPWKRANAADAQQDATPATVAQLKTELTEVRFGRIIGPIEAKAALAKKAMEPYEKEMKQPPDKRRQDVLVACKERSAQMYMAASMAAKRAQGLVQKKSHQLGIRKHYEQPYTKKAVDLLLDLAGDARSNRKMMQSVGYYKNILALDPDNHQAKTALKDLQEQYRQAMQDRKKGGGSAGGSNSDKNPWDWDYDSDHNRDWGSWREYSGTKGMW